MSENGTLPQPSEVITFLNDAAGESDTLGKRLEAAHISQGDAEAAWVDAKDIALLEILEEYESDPTRSLPGEDVRLALARKRIGFQVYRDWINARALVKGLENHGRKLDKAISARQSTLKAMQRDADLHTSGFTGENQRQGGYR